MEIHQLEYFVAIVETGGFSRAAERCNVAQPSLSQQIKKLEQELGRQLFDRLGHKVSLTETGNILLPHARKILEELQAIQVGVHKKIEDGYGALAVGFIPTIAPFALPGVIHRFSQEFSNAKFEVHEGLTEELIDKIIALELDVAIMSLPINNKLIHTEVLLTEPLLVAASQKYDLIHRASIQVTELGDFPFIALSEVHCLGEQVQSFCYQQDIDLDIVCHTAQLSTVHNCIAMGLGISLVPQALAISDPSNQVTYRATNHPFPQRKIVAATHAKRQTSFLTKQFIEIVRSEYPRDAFPS